MHWYNFFAENSNNTLQYLFHSAHGPDCVLVEDLYQAIKGRLLDEVVIPMIDETAKAHVEQLKL